MDHEPRAGRGTPDIAAVCGLDEPVRRELYEYVAMRGTAVGRDEAAAATGIGRPLAAYHLDKLVGLGLLTASYARPPGRGGPGAGRPAKVYARSEREFAVSVPPREYELAARLLADAIGAEPTGAARDALLRSARRIGRAIGARERRETGPGAGQHVASPGGGQAALRAALTRHGFEPCHGADGVIRLRNCPFHQLAAAQPEVTCGMNLALIEGIAEGIGARGARPALDPGPGRCCVTLTITAGQAEPPATRRRPGERHDD